MCGMFFDGCFLNNHFNLNQLVLNLTAFLSELDLNFNATWNRGITFEKWKSLSKKSGNREGLGTKLWFYRSIVNRKQKYPTISCKLINYYLPQTEGSSKGSLFFDIEVQELRLIRFSSIFCQAFSSCAMVKSFEIIWRILLIDNAFASI